MRQGDRIRPIDPGSRAEVEIVAARMRQTLVEVLGEERGTALYTMEWLVQRVLWHLDPDKSVAQVFLSEDGAGYVTGHTIVRVEHEDDGRELGLFSTTFVERESRRHGVASGLLQRGEAWMVERRLREAATYTADTNGKLIGLYRKHGYTLAPAPPEMVRMSKALPAYSFGPSL
jgi:GNAT superfamily N-acetyltransferase